MSKSRQLSDAINSVDISESAPADAVTLDASGNLLVGTTNASPVGSNVVGVALSSSLGRIQVSRDSGPPAFFNRKTNDGDIAIFRKDGSTVGAIGVVDGNDTYITGDNTAIRLGLGSSGAYVSPCNSDGSVRDGVIRLGDSSARWRDLYLSGGVYLGGTGAANYLDDYEEGTWTPTSKNSGTTSFVEARYTKIGNQVHVIVEGQGFSDTTSGTNLSIGGLPFAPAHDGTGAFMAQYRDTTEGVTVYISSTANEARLYLSSNTVGFSQLDHNTFNASNASVYWSATYFTS